MCFLITKPWMAPPGHLISHAEEGMGLKSHGHTTSKQGIPVSAGGQSEALSLWRLRTDICLSCPPMGAQGPVFTVEAKDAGVIQASSPSGPTHGVQGSVWVGPSWPPSPPPQGPCRPIP